MDKYGGSKVTVIGHENVKKYRNRNKSRKLQFFIVLSWADQIMPIFYGIHGQPVVQQ